MQSKGIVLSALFTSVLLAGCLAVAVTASISLAIEGDSYSQEVEKMTEEMTTIECARCHYDIFMSIKNGQGAHRLECRECHETFHGFRRGLNYADVLPACSDCHGAPHGEREEMLSCKVCHSVPHAPLASLTLKTLEPYCTTCHADPGARMESGRVDHNKLQCILCHSDRHGYVPTCQECHGSPHPQEMVQDFENCLDCHGNPHDLLLPSD